MNMPNNDEEGVEAVKRMTQGVIDAVRYHVGLANGRKEAFDTMRAFIYSREGDFYTKNILIDFPNKKARYLLLLEALIKNAGAEGFCSYEAIINHYIERKVEVPEGDEERGKMITNDMVELFRKRKEQKMPFPKTTDAGDRVIRRVRGRGLLFNNPVSGQ